jgi:orotate phosphoribosyltransferase
MSWDREKEEAAREIVTLLYEKRMIRTFYRDRAQGWTLISGLYSPLYIQLRPLVSYPEVFEKICRSMARMVREEAPQITVVVGIAMAGVPIAAGISLMGNIRAGFTRKMENVKSLKAFKEAIGSYGEHSLVEGELAPGDRVALVDDLVTRFDSKQIALEQVKHEVRKKDLADVDCRTVLVVLDREQGGLEAAREQGVDLLSLIPFRSVGLPLLEEVMDAREWEVISHYLRDPDHFQQKEVQRDVERMAGSV